MAMHNITADLFELQFKKWDTLKYQKKNIGKTGSGLKIREHPVVTISAEPGCDIHAVARLLARGFGFDIFDADIVDLVAKNAHLGRQLVETLDEKTRSSLDDWVSGDIFDDEFTSKKYLLNLRAVVLAIAAHGNAIIIGRGAAFLIQPGDRLALRLIAPLEDRARHAMRERDLSERQSREYVEKTARQCHSFVKKHFHADIEDPVHYNLVINTAFCKPKVIYEIVKTVVH